MLNYGSSCKNSTHLEVSPEIFKYSVHWLLLLRSILLTVFFFHLTPVNQCETGRKTNKTRQYDMLPKTIFTWISVQYIA